MILQIYTIIQTLISLVAIFTGFVVLSGILAGKRLDGWTKWFLVTAVATTITEFFFADFDHLNQSMKPTAAARNSLSVLATAPCRGLSLSR